MLSLNAPLLLCLVAIVHCNPVQQTLCSQVFVMNQYCSSQDPNYGQQESIADKLKAMNSTLMNFQDQIDSNKENVEEEIEEHRETMDQTLAKFRERMETHEARVAELESRIDEKLARCEEICPEKQAHPINCSSVNPEMAKIWNETGGVFDIYPSALNGEKLEVYCDTTTDGGGWLVFQRRMDGSVDFLRTWNEYENGFGDHDKEFWLGLDILHKLTSSNTYELRVDMEDWDGNKRFAQYSLFNIDGANRNYQLHVGGYSGDAGDSMTEAHDGMYFSATDRDNDQYNDGSCTQLFKGSWWYNTCHETNPNGQYFQQGPHTSYADGIEWKAWKGYYYSLKFIELKIRLLP